MPKLDPRRVREYFTRRDTVSRWWTPEEGPLSFHYDAELRVLDDHLEPGPAWRVLDVGTGRGRIGAHFAARGCQVIGVDLNPEMVELAREHAREHRLKDRFGVCEGSAEDLERFGTGCFDLVCCMELFDHLPDLGRALEQMRGALKPEGRLLFSYVPAESVYGALGNAYRIVRRASSREMMISRTYSLRTIQDQLAESRLQMDRYWGIGLMCVNAQTRLFTTNPVARMFTALARAEAARFPYYQVPWLARHCAHVLGVARPV